MPHALPPHPGYVDRCPLEAAGRRCDVKIVTDERGVPIRSMAGPVGGFTPADLQAAYGLPPGGGAGKIVAIFGGGSDYPNAEDDLNVYRSQYGLPPCTTANGCFMKIDGSGGTNYPPAGTDEGEQAIDMEMVSAACPACKVMLVEDGDLGLSLATVIKKGASAFSFSILYTWGSDANNAGQCQGLGFGDTSGLLVTAAMGDNGWPSTATWGPGACAGTVAVGGTSLKKDSSARGWSETTWSGTGSGCGTAVDKPAWQTDTGCAMRMAGDVSAVADPYTGVAFYNTLGGTGWGVVGGTSVAAPLTAGALTALGIANGHFTPEWIWRNTVSFYDVTTGNNGTCAGSAPYVCNAGDGYDGPTGWGTPNGALLATALPPGVAGGPCAAPTGAYAQSCTGCVAATRTTGCTLVCQSCTKIDGSQNPGPTLGLPCGGDVENVDGKLHCNAPPDAGSDGGHDAGDAGGIVDAGVHDAGGHDASVPPHPVPEAGGFADAAVANLDSSLGGAGGCGCTTAGDTTGSSRAGLAAGVLLMLVVRRRPRAEGVSLGSHRGRDASSPAPADRPGPAPRGMRGPPRGRAADGG